MGTRMDAVVAERHGPTIYCLECAEGDDGGGDDDDGGEDVTVQTGDLNEFCDCCLRKIGYVAGIDSYPDHRPSPHCKCQAN